MPVLIDVRTSAGLDGGRGERCNGRKTGALLWVVEKRDETRGTRRADIYTLEYYERLNEFLPRMQINIRRLAAVRQLDRRLCCPH